MANYYPHPPAGYGMGMPPPGGHPGMAPPPMGSMPAHMPAAASSSSGDYDPYQDQYAAAAAAPAAAAAASRPAASTPRDEIAEAQRRAAAAAAAALGEHNVSADFVQQAKAEAQVAEYMYQQQLLQQQQQMQHQAYMEAQLQQQQLMQQQEQAAAAAAEKQEKNKVKPTRMAGGEKWHDPTLAEWDPDDFRVFVGDLGNDCTEEALRKAFSHFPSMQKVRIVRDPATKKSKGFGFVSFKEGKDFLRALKEMNGKYVGSRPIKLRKSTAKDRDINERRKKEKKEKKMVKALLKAAEGHGAEK